MTSADETKRGIEYFKNIVEAGRILGLKEPRAVNQGNSYLFEITGFEKAWHFSTSRETINDLPNTKNLQQSALALARSLDDRFKNVDPNLYVTKLGRLLLIEIEWPPFPWVTDKGYAAASGQRISLQDYATKEVAFCVVQMTHMQTMAGGDSGPFIRPMHMVNTVRSGIDRGTVKFFPNSKSIPNEMPTLQLITNGTEEEAPDIQGYISQKVLRLAFKAGGGRKESRTWIADPWDAAYLGVAESDLREAAAILDAQEKIILSEDGDFASIGKSLLAVQTQTKPQKQPDLKLFKTPLGTYTLKESIGQGGAGIVYRAVDEDGQTHALKHQRSEGQSTRKNKRFKNELAFCMRSSHPNIISIEDWGLKEMDGKEVPFYVMPLFPKTLRSLMDEGSDDETLFQVFLEILDGVEAAHAAGVWHRDLKPENILYDNVLSRSVVTDFGIAHFPDELKRTTIETESSERLANFRYAAPEQKSNGEVDARADIFALGLILHEIFTGELLQGTQYMKVGEVKPELAFLDPVIEQMICQSPGDRLSTIKHVRAEIVKHLANKEADGQTDSVKISRKSEHRIKDAAKPAPVAYARYETTGPNAVRAEVYVRPSVEREDGFLYEDSFGESREEIEQQAATSLMVTNRKLISEGYIRMNYANLSGKRTFDI